MDTRRDLAVVTLVQDEPEFIHLWINHYRRHVADSRDLFVMIHSRGEIDERPPSSGETDPWRRAQATLASVHGVNAFLVHHALTSDHDWLVRTAEAFQAFLLQSYSWALYTDVDEFLFPTPNNEAGDRTLLDMVRRLGSEPRCAIRARGFEIVHQPGEAAWPEDLFDNGANASISCAEALKDRGSWYKSRRYSKTLLANFPMTWSAGLHRATGAGLEFSEKPPHRDLMLAHLHKVDFGLAMTRAQRSLAKKWSPSDLKRGRGWQNRIADEEAMRAYFGQNVDNDRPLEPDALRPIPVTVRRMLRGQ